MKAKISESMAAFKIKLMDIKEKYDIPAEKLKIIKKALEEGRWKLIGTAARGKDDAKFQAEFTAPHSYCTDHWD